MTPPSRPPQVEDELETEGLKGELDRGRATKFLASTLARFMERLGGPREEEEEAAARRGGPGPPGGEGRVRVRVSRIGPGRGRQQELPPPQRENPPLQRMESEVRELLAKEGLQAEGRAGGAAQYPPPSHYLPPSPSPPSRYPRHPLRPAGKIAIKIVPAGGAEEEEGRGLSEEDTQHLKEIFLNMLVRGGREHPPGAAAAGGAQGPLQRGLGVSPGGVALGVVPL